MCNTVEEVLHQLKKHDNFEKLFATQDNKVMYFEKLKLIKS